VAVWRYAVEAGSPHPLGAVADEHGVNFSVFSQNAEAVELLLFNEHDDAEPVQAVALDPRRHKTFHFWHAYVRGLKPGMHYAYRVNGPRDAARGHRFNPSKVLIDPYARGITKNLWRRGDACGDGENLGTSMRGAIVDAGGYDWEGDRPLGRPLAESVVYEMHVGGFTKSPTSGAAHPGTFTGVVEKIPYLQELGVTAVELMPVFEFDDREVLRTFDGRPLRNYWGYSTMGFFAPHSGYCVSPEEGLHAREFRDMVKALHRAGIEVILDVVFNHTDEGNHEGPTFSFKGFDNEVYYHLVRGDKRYYMDYSGCGNTFNCNHPIAAKFIQDCLEYWVREMHVDGFRFDEGSILSRGEDGAPQAHPTVTWNIELSDALAGTKIIAEAWDAAGLYQIGYFPGSRWAEWNGRFRDDLRRFVKGDAGLTAAVASRLSGSSDIYQASGHLPINSVNFVTCHDGFTLNDLVSFNEKRNEANGEGNRDGIGENLSWNCGVEGPSGDPAVEALRERQLKNFAALLLLGQGVPMINSGDEVRRTQKGNNNAYCQDNELSWFDWDLVEKHKDLLRFWSGMIALRRAHPALHRSRFFTGERNERGLKDVEWHGTLLAEPAWDDPGARALAYTLGGFEGGADLHVMINMHSEALDFMVPAAPGRDWFRTVDTARPSPEDVAETGKEIPFNGTSYAVSARSVVVLISK
jgi:glycogen operon protein